MVFSRDVTLLVSSCDVYEDAWMPFFRLWKNFWNDFPYKTVLCTESKQFNCDFMDVKTVNTGNEKCWTKRLRYALKQIDTEYVLFSLEDFFLLKEVDTELFGRALDLMKNQTDIGVINFYKRKLDSVFPAENNIETCFKEVEKNHKNRTDVVISLWRREYFLKLLIEDEDPWTYENESRIRARFAGYRIFAQDYKCSAPVFHYCINPADGFGITQRKWLENNKPFFESQGIYGVNYDNLGYFSEKVSYESIKKASEYNRDNQKKLHKKQLEGLKGVAKIKEYLYDFIKLIKNQGLYKKILYIKKCVRYFLYYKTNK